MLQQSAVVVRYLTLDISLIKLHIRWSNAAFNLHIMVGNESNVQLGNPFWQSNLKSFCSTRLNGSVAFTIKFRINLSNSPRKMHLE